MTINWAQIEGESGEAVRSHLFSAIQYIARQVQLKERDDPDVLQSVPRLAELLDRRGDLSDFKMILDSLARSVGLWNYIDRANADSPELVIAEAALIPELGNITLHREQQVALATLLAGRNLILSAPTSFGKSLLIDALLVTGAYDRIAIVLPTIALMDEFRRRLTERFGGTYDVLMHHSERQTKEKVIFLGTQERLINRDDLGILDLAIVDEFYKLDPNRGDQRSVVLNAAVYKLLGKARQFFFLGPNIDGVSVSGDSRWKFEFLKTRFSTVAVDTFDLQGVTDKSARLATEVYDSDNWPALVFVSSPDRANVLAKELCVEHESVGSAGSLADWIDHNYGAGWPLSDAVRGGIAVHHGRVPRALASRFVKLFNNRSLPILLCTSTLIEGVNTAAKSVLIFDKKINREDYDFFTFSNIRGRAGRLGQHHVGKVFLFHGSPMQDAIDVAPPLFGDLDDAPDEMVVHIDQQELTPELKGRIQDVTCPHWPYQ